MQRLLPPYLFGLCAIAMVILRFALPIAVVVPSSASLAGWPIFAAGLAMSMWGWIRFGRARTTLITFADPSVLVVDGLFRRTRNPMYLGALVALLGLALGMRAVSPFLGVVLFFIAGDRWYIPFEEDRMNEKFGEAYSDYARKTRRWL